MLHMFVAADIDDVVVVTSHIDIPAVWIRFSSAGGYKDMVFIDDGGCYFWRAAAAEI